MSALPRGITRHKNLFAVTVRYRGHKATAIEPTLFLAEIRKGQLLEALINEEPVGVPPPKPGVTLWTMEHGYDRVSELIWSEKPGGKNSMRAARTAMTYFGRNTLLETITTHMIDHFVQSLRYRRLSDSSINTHLSALSKILRFAHTRGGSTHLPIITRQKLPPGRTRYVTAVEEAKMFNYLETHPARGGAPFVRMLLDTGMRVSELLSLTENDVDFERDLILIWRNKGNKPRAIPMTTRVRKILRLKAKGRPDEKFFPHTYKYYRRTWKQVRQVLGLEKDPGFVIHCLRHTCASRLIHHGVHILTVKEWMGHKSIAATLRYIHLAPKNLYDAAQVLETGRTPSPRQVVWEGHPGGWQSPRRGL